MLVDRLQLVRTPLMWIFQRDLKTVILGLNSCIINCLPNSMTLNVSARVLLSFKIISNDYGRWFRPFLIGTRPLNHWFSNNWWIFLRWDNRLCLKQKLMLWAMRFQLNWLRISWFFQRLRRVVQTSYHY